MKNIVLGLVFSSLISILQAQIVNIPDVNFKDQLVYNKLINTNRDTEIQVSEAVSFTGEINVNGKSIKDLTGIEAFVNLTEFYCIHNFLKELDVTQNMKLKILWCAANLFKDIDLSKNVDLTSLSISQNELTNLDLTHNINLTRLECSDNMLTSLNLTNNLNLSFIDCPVNPHLFEICIDISHQTFEWKKDNQASYNTKCVVTDIQGITPGFPEKQLLGVYNLQGQRIFEDEKGFLIKIYTDGSKEKIFHY